MIHVTNVSKRNASSKLLNDVSFSAPAGRVTALVGPSGSGKTLLLKIATGLVSCDAGLIRFGHQTYAELPSPLRAVGLAMSYPIFTPSLTLKTQLRATARSSHIDGARVEAVIDLAGLTAVKTKRINQLPGAIVKRLGVASALLGDPSFLLFDDPFAGLDNDALNWTKLMLRHAASQGRTVLITAESVRDVAGVADNLVELDAGKVVSAGPFNQAVQQGGSDGSETTLSAWPSGGA